MEDIIWMSALDVANIHEDVIASSGGLPGLKSHGAVEAVVMRVQNHLHYIGVRDFSELVATLGYSIVKGHAFNDGNKRTALITVDVFAQINGYDIFAPPLEFAEQLIAIADNKLNQEQFANWLRARMHRK